MEPAVAVGPRGTLESRHKSCAADHHAITRIPQRNQGLWGALSVLGKPHGRAGGCLASRRQAGHWAGTLSFLDFPCLPHFLQPPAPDQNRIHAANSASSTHTQGINKPTEHRPHAGSAAQLKRDRTTGCFRIPNTETGKRRTQRAEEMNLTAGFAGRSKRSDS